MPRPHPYLPTRTVLLVGALFATSACGGASGAAGAAHADTSAPSSAPQNPFSRYPVYSLDGQEVHLLREAAGRILIVDLWATWCTACERTHPLLEKLAQSYDPKDVLVVGVSVDESTAKVQRYVQTHAYSYPIFLDRNYRLSDALGISELPIVYVLDESGTIVQKTHELDEEALATIRATVTRRQVKDHPSVDGGP